MASVDFTVKQNDTRPAIQAVISAAPTDVISSVTFTMADKTGTRKVNAASGTIVNQPSSTAQAQVKYQWQVGDTDTVGTYYAEFRCTFNDGRIETYPNNKTLVVEVTKAL